MSTLKVVSIFFKLFCVARGIIQSNQYTQNLAKRPPCTVEDPQQYQHRVPEKLVMEICCIQGVCMYYTTYYLQKHFKEHSFKASSLLVRVRANFNQETMKHKHNFQQIFYAQTIFSLRHRLGNIRERVKLLGYTFGLELSTSLHVCEFGVWKRNDFALLPAKTAI